MNIISKRVQASGEKQGTESSGISRKVRFMTVTALMTAVLCVVSPFQIPIGEVPVTLSTMAVVLVSVLTGTKCGFAACLLYILIGAAGVPVFSGFRGGLSVLTGPTGGYIAGYLLLVLIGGIVHDLFTVRLKPRRVLYYAATLAVFLAGMAVLYLAGTLWFMKVTGAEWAHALAVCVYPFIPLDIAKTALGIVLADLISVRLVRTGLSL